MQRLCVFVLMTFFVAIAPRPALSQEFRSTVSGRVHDTQEAVVPGARVEAVNADTNANFATVTGDTGQYTLPFLPPGRYTITCHVDGFKRFVRENVVVTANTRVSVDIALEIGNVAESVTITAGAPLLATGTASVGQSVVTQHLDDLPMAGRAPMVLTRLAIGMVDLTNPAYNTRPFDTSGTSTYAIGGGRSTSNEILMNAIPNMARYRVVAYNPPLDSVQEVKVEVFQADAAYGNTAGGTINMITKSGTNQFHGTLGLYNQTSALAANLFFTNMAGIKKGDNKYWQWGGSIGGPVIIPKLFNGKNKLFWFFAYDGIYSFRPVPEGATMTVPTDAMRRGDLSGLLAFGSSYQLYDPASAVAEGTRRRRQPLAGNIIPPSKIDPVAKNYLAYYPLPNQAGILNGQQNNFLSTPADTDRYWNYLGRMDFNISDRHKLYIGGHSNWRRVDYHQWWPGPATGLWRYRIGSGGHMDDVFTFSPTTLLNTRIGWSRFDDPDKIMSDGFNITSLGFPSYMVAKSVRPLMPGVNFGDSMQDFGGGTGYTAPFVTEQLFTALTKVTGDHTLKFGGDIRRLRQNTIVYGNAGGTFDFAHNWMNGPLDNATAAPLGQGFASFLYGLPTGGSYDINSANSYKSWYASVFIQDDWRPIQGLTLNVGLRYEKETSATERYNRALVGFDYTTANSITAAAKQAYAAKPVTQVPVGSFNPVGGPIFASPGNTAIYRTPNTNFSPRVGLAYTPRFLGSHTVIRAGMGLFFQPYGTLPFGSTSGGAGAVQPGFSQTTPLVATLDGYLTPSVSLSNPFPNGILSPVGAANGVNQNLGQSVDYVAPSFLTPYLVRWTFSVQRELARDLVTEVGYVGSHGVHLDLTKSLNFVPAGFLSTSPVRDQATINLVTSNVANPFQGLLPNTTLNGSTVQLSQLLRAYPQYAGDSGLRVRPDNQGYSNYHMLSTRVEKRFSYGIQLLASWTFSKMISATGLLNASDPGPERRIASEDRPHRFVVSGSYELPVGKGKLIASSASRLLDGVIGGWKVGGILTLQSGAALGWGNLIYYGGDIKLQPNYADGPAFDTSRFNTSSRDQLAQNIRTFPSAFSDLRSAGNKNLDLNVQKDVRLREGLRLQFRADAFNALNRTMFGAPNLSAGSAGFGWITSQVNISRFMQMSLRAIF